MKMTVRCDVAEIDHLKVLILNLALRWVEVNEEKGDNSFHMFFAGICEYSLALL